MKRKMLSNILDEMNKKATPFRGNNYLRPEEAVTAILKFSPLHSIECGKCENCVYDTSGIKCNKFITRPHNLPKNTLGVSINKKFGCNEFEDK